MVPEGGAGREVSKRSLAMLQVEKWYAERGVPYQDEVIYLHGPPGGIEESFFLALAVLLDSCNSVCYQR